MGVTGLIILFVVALLTVIIYEVYRKGKNALIAEKWKAYRNAIESGNKQAALNAGRAYYAELRGGELTMYDEQAIANDLSTIK